MSKFEDVVYHLSSGFADAAETTFPFLNQVARRVGIPALVAGGVGGIVLAGAANLVSAAAIVGIGAAAAAVTGAVVVGGYAADMVCRLAGVGAGPISREPLSPNKQINIQRTGFGLFLVFSAACGYQAATKTHEHFSNQAAANNNYSTQAAEPSSSSTLRDTFTIQTSDKGGCVIVLTGYPQTAQVTFGECTVAPTRK